jgi:putative membrane protein
VYIAILAKGEKSMSKILYAIVIALIALIGVIFAILNAETVQINYYFGYKEAPLSLAIVLSMLLGAILGMFASLGLILKSKREVSKLKRVADVAEKEVANLRAIPIKNQH